MNRTARWATGLLLGLTVLGVVGLSPAQAQPVKLKDDRGAVLQLPAPPQRIVSLLPSLTESVCALGECARLVATDRYSNHPEAVQKLPKLGGLDDTSVEAVLALKPDVVLLALSSRLTERLEALGLKVVALEPKSHADVRRIVGVLGQLLARPREAQQLWQRIDAGITQAAEQVPASMRGTRVYYEVDAAPYAAGPQSFIGETLARLGLNNIVPPELGPFPKLNPEFVVRADPALIMVGQRSATGLPQRPGWSRISAVQRQQLCVWRAHESDVLVRPGPRMDEAAQLMLRCLRQAAAGPVPLPPLNGALPAAGGMR
ncbi:ABC transporter substrate-binding protein [Roseateles sp. BYS180W]|uniref:ABC transporter substrate-binding protein n=1 Tax=Roseateles rivi TaxID=3299028 RepID=A0ABW7FX97_9BURK